VPENRLAKERSPYLRQHRTNPVDWYPWGEEAFARARELDRPVFLSVGYAACHWCHVMEHESFEDPATAALLNEAFVCVKVDREERPDVDALYMQVVQLFGRGGWPMTVLLTPDGRPLLGATYLPAASVQDLCRQITRLWGEDRARLLQQADALTERVQAMSDGPDLPATDADDATLLELARTAMAARFDSKHAGFGDEGSGWRPKFPPHAELLWVLEEPEAAGADALEQARRTLEAMERGGLHDHVGGGFHRYSTDRAWVLPHFEKMLYDNALLARACAAGARQFEAPRLARAARRTFAWLEREMKRPGGGYASSLDADTDGEEGTTITWTAAELAERLTPEQAAVVFDLAGITTEGNFQDEATHRATGRNILHLARPLAEVAARRGLEVPEVLGRWDAAMEALAAPRAARPQPGLDDKVITGWNGLLVSAFARAGRDLDDPALVGRARELAGFLLTACRREDGTLLRFPRGSGPEIPGFCEDHVHLLEGLLDLEDVTGESTWRDAAHDLARRLVAGFQDEQRGGFWRASAEQHEPLLARTKETWDSPIPSDNGTAARALQRLALRTGDAALATAARRTLTAFRPMMGYARMAPGLIALYRALGDAAAGTVAPASAGADVQARSDVVAARAWIERSATRPGQRVALRIELDVDEGWHVGPAGAADDPAATRLTWAAPLPGMRLEALRVSGVRGTITLDAEIVVAEDAAPGPRRLPLQLLVQPCDERGTCLLPVTLPLALALRIGDEDGAPRHPQRFVR
jgi:uncharacterized protein YyaL (SSP411 family)